jgi:capsule polysaccharide modification protein KpsS
MNIIFLSNVSVLNIRNTFFLNLAILLQDHGHGIFLLDPPSKIVHQWKTYISSVSIVYTGERKETLSKIIRRNKIERVVVWNGTFHKDVLSLCKKGGAFVWYMENGYFPGTFQMNRGGVNAKSDFANYSADKLSSFKYPSIVLERRKYNVLLHKDVISLSHVVNRIFHLFIFPRYLQIMVRRSMLFWYKHIPDTKLKPNTVKNFAFFPLQVNQDTQITHNSNWHDMREILETIIPILREKGKILVFKTHPAEYGFIRYAYFTRNNDVFFTRRGSLEEFIDMSDFVISVNSSVGLQSLGRGKKVLLLGDAFYASLPGVVVCKKGDDISACIELVEQLSPDWEETRVAIASLKEHVFIKGDWRNPDSEFLYRICERLLA